MITFEGSVCPSALLKPELPAIEIQILASAQDKTFRKRLIELTNGASPFKIGKGKRLFMNFWAFRYLLNGEVFETPFKSDVPDGVDNDLVELVFEAEWKISDNLFLPALQFSIKSNRSRL